MTVVGVLHPGAMGVTVAACAASVGAEVLRCSAGRSSESIERATSAGLTAVDTLAELVERSDVVVSVCPPGAAVDVADQVAAVGFDGVYVDANAIARRRRGWSERGSSDSSTAASSAHRRNGPGPRGCTCRATRQPRSHRCGTVTARRPAHRRWPRRCVCVEDRLRHVDQGVGRDVAGREGTRPSGGRGGRTARRVDDLAAHDLPTGFGDAAREIFGRMTGFKGVDDATLDAVLETITSRV